MAVLDGGSSTHGGGARPTVAALQRASSTHGDNTRPTAVALDLRRHSTVLERREGKRERGKREEKEEEGGEELVVEAPGRGSGMKEKKRLRKRGKR